MLQFLARSSLVRYDRVVNARDRDLAASDPAFAAELRRVLARNREILDGFIADLGATGKQGRIELSAIRQGYQSKVLHIIAHFLDGFIGIDSAFYNLVDDSHWLPEATASLLKNEPGKYWLLALDCYSMSPKEAALLHR
ncbi:MAG: hypothetical protein IH612_04445 [Desulfofustis sp.]|nr:hypothetical protein [Desulfofustis sp.]